MLNQGQELKTIALLRLVLICLMNLLTPQLPHGRPYALYPRSCLFYFAGVKQR